LKKLLAVIILAAICLSLAACGTDPNKPVSYQSAYLGLTLDYPGSWDLRDNMKAETGLDVSIEYTAPDNMSAVFGISMSPAVPDIEKYDAEDAIVNSGNFQDVKDFTSEVITFLGNEKTLYIKFTHRFDSFDTQTEQYMQNRGDRLYVYVFSVEKKRFSEVEDGFVHIRKTLEYIGEPTGTEPASLVTGAVTDAVTTDFVTDFATMAPTPFTTLAPTGLEE